MSDAVILLDAAGRRRSPATTPGFLAGRAPRNKGMEYPPEAGSASVAKGGDDCAGGAARSALRGVIPGWSLDSLSVVDARRDFEMVYAACEPAVRAFVLRRTGPDGVDDVVSEVFLAGWRRYGEIPADPLPWLLGIARGALANRRRSNGRASALLERLTQEEAAINTARSAEVDLGVADALARMSPADQELLLLVAWEGLSGAQLAVAVGAPRAAVAMRLSRARRRFARALKSPSRVEPRRGSSTLEVSK